MNKELDVSSVTRLETIDQTPCANCQGSGRVENPGYTTRFLRCDNCSGSGKVGRSVIFHDLDKQIELSLQDDGKTLKIFINERVEK